MTDRIYAELPGISDTYNQDPFTRPKVISVNLPGIEAYYCQVQGSSVWRMADCFDNQPLPPLSQKITGARVRTILETAGLGAASSDPQTNLAAAIEEIHRRAVAATAIKDELTKRRARQRRVVDAVATLRHHLQSSIDRRQREAESESHGGRLLEGSIVTETRAMLASLDQVRGMPSAPPPRLEAPWRDAALQLACI